jgi:arylsulfatase A-like enzyme
LLPFPVSTAGQFVRWLLRLAIVVSPDICFVAMLAAACLMAAWCCSRRHRLIVAIGTYLLFYLAAVYAVASVPIYRFTMVPLTLPSLFLMGGGESASSLGACVGAGTIAALFLAPLAVVGGGVLLARRDWPRRLLPKGRLAIVAVLGLVAAYGAVCHVYVQRCWDDPNRWERRIAQSPHAVFVASCVAELWHADALEMFGDPDESDFVITPSQPKVRLASFAKDDKRPRNVLLIVLESTTVEYVSLYGARYPTMPNLERLARSGGVVFDNVYVQTPSSCQSLAALTASIYPRPDWGLMVRDEPDFDVPTIAEVLGDRGYRTCFAHSGYWRWKNRDRFLRSRGAQTLLDADNIAGEQVNTWGVADRAMFQATLDWIDQDRSRPFFALAYTIETHHPYVARGPLHDFGVGHEDFNRYLNALRATDETISWLMAELRRRGLEETTLVAVTADHGESFGQHNQRIHSFSVYESAVHVPLVLLHAALRNEQPPRVADVARHIDIAPTLLDALGIEAPADWQGRSLLTWGRRSYLPDRQEGPPHEPPQNTAYFFATGNQVILGLRRGQYKYHYHLATGHEELFDLSADPGETTNLAAEDQQRCAAYKRKLGGFVSYQRRFLAEHRAR